MALKEEEEHLVEISGLRENGPKEDKNTNLASNLRFGPSYVFEKSVAS